LNIFKKKKEVPQTKEPRFRYTSKSGNVAPPPGKLTWKEKIANRVSEKFGGDVWKELGEILLDGAKIGGGTLLGYFLKAAHDYYKEKEEMTE